MYSGYGNAVSETLGLFFIVYLIVDAVGAYFMGKAAEEKGYNGWKCFWICFLLSIMGYMYVIALPNKKLMDQNNLILSRLNFAALENTGQPQQKPAIMSDELPDL